MGPEALAKSLTPRAETKDSVDLRAQLGRDLVDGSLRMGHLSVLSFILTSLEIPISLGVVAVT